MFCVSGVMRSGVWGNDEMLEDQNMAVDKPKVAMVMSFSHICGDLEGSLLRQGGLHSGGYSEQGCSREGIIKRPGQTLLYSFNPLEID